LDEFRLLVAKGQAVSAEPKLGRIAQWGTAEDFNLGAVAEAHFQQPATDIHIAANRDDPSPAPYPKTVQSACLHGTTVIAASQITCLLHCRLPSPDFHAR
jgi:hypothetical protein